MLMLVDCSVRWSRSSTTCHIHLVITFTFTHHRTLGSFKTARPWRPHARQKVEIVHSGISLIRIYTILQSASTVSPWLGQPPDEIPCHARHLYFYTPVCPERRAEKDRAMNYVRRSRLPTPMTSLRKMSSQSEEEGLGNDLCRP